MQLSLMTADRIQLGRSEFAIAMLTGFVEEVRKVGLSFPRVSQTPATHEHVSGSGEPPGTGRRV
jgi:hypothetical protein